MTKPFQPSADLPPEIPIATERDTQGAWAVITFRREPIHEITAIRFPHLDPLLRRELVDHVMDLAVILPDSFGKVLESWRQLDRSGDLKRTAGIKRRGVL